MSVKIRLARFGAKKQPYYRMVVADSHSPRDGRFIEQVGTYDPRKETDKVTLKTDKIKMWLDRGAKPSGTVSNILKTQGILEQVAAKPAPAEEATQGA